MTPAIFSQTAFTAGRAMSHGNAEVGLANRFFDFIEALPRISKEGVVAGAIRVLEFLVRIILRVRLLGMLFAPISRFSFRIYPAALIALAA